MPEKLVWTDCRDTALRSLRAAGTPWERIAGELGISRNAALERARRIGIRRQMPVPVPRPVPEDPNRPPLPPGHPVAWSVITAGTLLEGTAYPLPVFPGCDA